MPLASHVLSPRIRLARVTAKKTKKTIPKAPNNAEVVAAEPFLVKKEITLADEALAFGVLR